MNSDTVTHCISDFLRFFRISKAEEDFVRDPALFKQYLEAHYQTEIIKVANGYVHNNYGRALYER